NLTKSGAGNNAISTLVAGQTNRVAAVDFEQTGAFVETGINAAGAVTLRTDNTLTGTGGAIKGTTLTLDGVTANHGTFNLTTSGAGGNAVATLVAGGANQGVTVDFEQTG